MEPLARQVPRMPLPLVSLLRLRFVVGSASIGRLGRVNLTFTSRRSVGLNAAQRMKSTSSTITL